MATKLHLDFETFSAIDIRDVGAYRYAFDPSTEILCAAMAFDDEEPVAWFEGYEDKADYSLAKHIDALEDPSVLIYAHNAMFEMAICQALLMKTWGIPCPDLSRFRCTMSLARRAALPGKLETLAETLGLTNLKDNRGKALIKKFSMMQPAKKPTKKNPAGLPIRRIRPEDEPEAFAEFVEYCRQDVRVEQEVSRKLAYFDDELNNKNYSLDAKINARGVPVNLSALRHAQKLIDEETAIVSAQFRELCGFEVTQNARLLEWVKQYDHTIENLQAETVDSFLAEHEDDENPHLVVRALRLKQSIAYASIKKVRTMLDCAGPHDNRIRGMKNHHGAGTGRDTNSLVQFQNIKRSVYPYSEDAYRDICAGMDREMFELCYGPVLEVLSSCVRHFVHDVCPKERPILDADYSGIEARVVCWLAGEESALERFRRYDAAATKEEKFALDPYRVMAADVYRILVSEVQKFPHRFVGKGLVLGAGFKLSPAGFRRQCLDQAKYDLPEGEEHHAIGLWRKKHKNVVAWWGDLDDASKKAILHRGRVFTAGKVSFMCKDIEGVNFLLMKLPSGRKIAYPRPRLVPGKFEGTTQIEYFGNDRGVMWGWCRLWAGVLANNATQGTAADILNHGAHNAENAGYGIFTLIHDQSLTFREEGQTAERLVELLTDLPDWAEGLPIAAEGGVVPFYKKD